MVGGFGCRLARGSQLCARLAALRLSAAASGGALGRPSNLACHPAEERSDEGPTIRVTRERQYILRFAQDDKHRCSSRQPWAPPQAGAASPKAASRAHRRQRLASRQPPPPTIAASDAAQFRACCSVGPSRRARRRKLFGGRDSSTALEQCARRSRG